MEPKFSRQVATVMNSPYWGGGQGLERFTQKAKLQSLLLKAKSVDDLPPNAKALFMIALSKAGHDA